MRAKLLLKARYATSKFRTLLFQSDKIRIFSMEAVPKSPGSTVFKEGYAKPSLKKCRPIAARNEDKKVFSGRL